MNRDASSRAYFAPGERIPGTKLRVERTLGRGGQGEVHLVVNEVSHQKQVIKLLHPELVRSESAMARFEKEVRLMAMLTHPHVVKLLHTDVSAAAGTRPALPYSLMEHLEGESLAETFASATPSMPWRAAVRFFAEVADALGYAATKVGLVHRDLKPANLFVARTADGNPFAKVLDFGISQLCEALTSVTSDDFLGTEHYAAPEQYAGRTSPKTDTYQLGIVLWETFAGYHPFHDKTTRQAIMYAQLELVPPALVTVVNGCPQALSNLVDGMVAKDPRQRPSMEVVAATLRTLEGDASLADRQIAYGRRAPWEKPAEEASVASAHIEEPEQAALPAAIRLSPEPVDASLPFAATMPAPDTAATRRTPSPSRASAHSNDDAGDPETENALDAAPNEVGPVVRRRRYGIDFWIFLLLGFGATALLAGIVYVAVVYGFGPAESPTPRAVPSTSP